MKISQENQDSKKEEKNKNDNMNIISQEDLTNINNINNSERKNEFFNNTKRSDNMKKNNFDPNDSNVLNYNYLETERINVEEDDNYNIIDNNKSLEEIIHKLKEENKELKDDMKKLYFLTQENKNNLLEHIQMLKEENFKLKNDKKNLEYKLLITESKNSELLADKEKEENENKIIQQRYLNEIKELNCQLNNYKIKLNNLKFNYEQLLNDFQYVQKDKI